MKVLAAKRSGLLALTLLSACSQHTPLVKIQSVEPSLIPVRQAQQVTVHVDQWQPGNQLAVLPGGAYLSQHIPVVGQQIISQYGMSWINTGQQVQGYAEGSEGLQFIGEFHTGQQILAMSTQEQWIYLSDTHPAITVVDTSEPLQVRKLGELLLDSPAEKLASSTDHLCALQSTQLLYIPLEEGLPQSVAGQTRLPHANFDIAASPDGCLALDRTQGIRNYQWRKGKLTLRDEYRSNSHSFALSGNQWPVAVADGNTGLTLLQRNKQQQLQWAGSYNKLGTITLISKLDDRVLVADDRGILSLFDISRPATPLLLSDFRLPAAPRAIALDQGLAHVLTDTELLLIDFSAESTPAISNLGVNLGGSRRSFIENDVLYVADWFSGLHIYDISKPNSPRLISSFKTPGSPKGVLVRDGIAYVADDDKGMQFIDVSDVRHPKLISHLQLDGLCYTMKLRGDWLYLAAHYGGFHILNVADAKKPRLVGTVNTPAKAWAVALLDNLAFVADDNSGILIFDVRDPAKPQLKGVYDPKGFAEDIVIRDGIAYVAFFDQGLHILDLRADPTKPKLISKLATPGNARGIQLKDKRLYLASWDAGLHILDISNLKQPKIIGQYDTAGATWGLSEKNDYLYAMDWWGGVRVIDIHQETAPQEIAQYQGAAQILALTLKDNFAFAANGSRGLQVFDTTNVLNPVWATGVDLDGEARDVAVQGNYAYIAAGDGGLVVVDISNPFQSHWVARLPMKGMADRVLAHGNTLFLMEHAGDLRLIDISQPTQPRLLRSLSLQAHDIWLQNDTLLISNNHREILLFDVKNMTDLEPLQKIVINSPKIVRAWQDKLFVAQQNFGVRSFELRNGQYVESHSLPYSGDIEDLQLRDHTLFASVRNQGLLHIDANRMKLESLYPTTHDITRIALNKDAIFFAGEAIITSARLLPDVSQQQDGLAIQLSLPADLPIGSYHLLIQQADGQQQVLHNAFKVSFPKKKKSKFTLEDFQNIMKQKDFEGQAPK